MFNDEEKPKKDSGFKNLENMSIEEIEDYIMELQAEITKAEQDIEKKRSSADAANSVFK